MKKEVKGSAILKKPEYPGGIKALKAFISKHLQYPEEALKEKIEGTVHIRYGIDHTGMVTDIKVIKGLGGGCSEEAIRLVGMLRFHLERTRGVRVLFHKKIQIHFRLPPPQEVKSSPSIGYTITPSVKKAVPTTTSKKSYTITITYSS
ncbi:MAG: TonB family protein [Saprospiraceae bacterium]|nr:TonB family protein [Saprospiraceae bacterium]